MSVPRIVLVLLALALAAASPVRALDLDQVCDLPLNNNTHTCVIRNDKSFPPPPAQVIFDIGDWNLRVQAGVTVRALSSITSPTVSHAGQLTLKANSVFLEAGATMVASTDANGNGGHLTLVALQGITLDVSGVHRSSIDVRSSNVAGTLGPSAVAGTMDLTAGGDVLVNGLLLATGTPGSGGNINVTSGGNVTIKGTGLVQAGGGVQGVGGSVTVVGTGPVLLDSSIDATGTLGGGSLDLESLADLTTTANAPLTVNSVDTGGDVLFDVVGSLTVGAKIDLSGQPGPDFGGNGGEIDMLVDGDITLHAPIDLSGTAPDGAGGLADLEAGGAFTQDAGASILAGAPGGADSGGGDVSLTAGTDLQVGPIDTSGGGFGGGSIDAEGQGLTTVLGEQNADGDDAGDITMIGLTVKFQANAHALAQVTDGTGGSINAAGCEIDVPQGATLAMTGSVSGALLQASGPMTIGGTVTSDGPNAFQYLDTVPVILGSAVIQPPTTPLRNPALPTCANLFPPPFTTTTTTVPGATTTTTSTIGGGGTTTTTVPGTTTSTSTSTIPAGTTTSTSLTTTSTNTSTSLIATSTSTSTSLQASTSSSTTITTTTSSVTTTSKPTSTTSSTTTSTLPECTAADLTACDDQEPCTADSCAGGHCVNDQKTGLDGVTCKLETLNIDLTNAGATNLGGGKRAAALLGKVAKARSFVDASRPLSGKKHLKKLKSANKQVAAFMKVVKAGELHGKVKIAGPMADLLLGLASQATSRLEQLIVTP